MTSPRDPSATPHSPKTAQHSPKTAQHSPKTGQHSPKTAEDWELIRRSVAMLPPGAWAMRREQALESLSSLVEGLRAARQRDQSPPRSNR